MRPRVLSLRWLPPFLVGIATASCAEVGAVLLLYSGPGMLRSLTIVLVVESAALGLGFWSARATGANRLDTIRRRWFLYLVSILAATIFAGVWSLIEHLGRTRLEQGLGLAFLGALPLYACGTLLGTMGADGASDGQSSVATSAAMGATLGFAATGLTLTRVVTPASLLLTALALVSAAGLVHGAILEATEATEARSEAAPDAVSVHDDAPVESSEALDDSP